MNVDDKKIDELEKEILACLERFKDGDNKEAALNEGFCWGVFWITHRISRDLGISLYEANRTAHELMNKWKEVKKK